MIDLYQTPIVGRLAVIREMLPMVSAIFCKIVGHVHATCTVSCAGQLLSKVHGRGLLYPLAQIIAGSLASACGWETVIPSVPNRIISDLPMLLACF